MAELDEVIEAACEPWAHQIELLQTIPGVGPKVAQVFIAETGGDMSRFPSAAHLAAWAGLAPAMYESAGKRPRLVAGAGTSGCPRCSSRPPGRSGRMHGKNYLAEQHARLTRRRGMSRAQIAVAHSILTTPTTCSNATSPTATSAPTGWPSGTRKPTPAGWSRSSRSSDTPWSSTPPA